MQTACMALLEALDQAGVAYIFANLGSDHPPLVEAMAEARATGRRVPAIVTCPNEMVALSAAHGYAQVIGTRAGGAGACGMRHAGAGGRRAQRLQGPRAGRDPRRRVALYAGRRAARQPQRVHPVDPGRARPARHRARLHALRHRAAHRAQHQADGVPRAAVRQQRPEGPGLSDGRAGSDGGRSAAGRDRSGRLAADRARRPAARCGRAARRGADGGAAAAGRHVLSRARAGGGRGTGAAVRAARRRRAGTRCRTR